MKKVGTKYLHFKCRRCGQSWTETIGSPEYSSKNYAVLKHTSQDKQSEIYGEKLFQNFKRYASRFGDNIAWDQIVIDQGSYEEAVTALKKMNTPDLIVYVNSYEVVP
jgi:hypothetical protein